MYRVQTLLCAFVSMLSFWAAPVSAEEPHKQRMEALSFLVGSWEGRGWTEYAPGLRRDFTHIEEVQAKLGGTVLLIEGVGKNRILGSEDEIVTYQGMSVLSWSPESESYRYSAYQLSGRAQDADFVEVRDQSFTWAFHDVPDVGQVRFRVDLTPEGDWFETAETSEDDGQTWSRIFEMTLKKKSSG